MAGVTAEYSVGDRVTVVKLEDDVMGVNGQQGRVVARHVEKPDYWVVDLRTCTIVLHSGEMLVRKGSGRHAEAVARALMSAMGCAIQEDTPDCGHDGMCQGHGSFTYCAVHDWEEDWMDWDRGRLCLYAVELGTKLAGSAELDPWWDSVKVAMEARNAGR